MKDAVTTENLGIPLLLGSDLVLKEGINRGFQSIDEKTLPLTHALTKAHFTMWQPSTEYKKQDVVRTASCPNWGFYMCVEPGCSGVAEPIGYGEGDVIADGTCTWKLKLFGGATFIMHDDLKGRNIPDQHTVSAVTGLADLLERKATKEDLIQAIDNLVDGAPETLDTLKKIADALAEDDQDMQEIRQILRIKVDKEDGKGLSANDYTNADKSKINHITVTQDVDLDRLAKNAHTHKNQAILDKFGEEKNTATYAGKMLAGGASLWKAWEEYRENMLVVYEDKLYRCAKDHTAEERFKQVYWHSLTAELRDLHQVTKLKVTAPQDVEIPISYTSRFNLPPVEVLKFNPEGGDQDQVVAVCSFDNADADAFWVNGQSAQLDDELIFDGTMRLKTKFDLPCGEVVAMDDDSLCESAYVDFSKYKKIETIRGGFF